MVSEDRLVDELKKQKVSTGRKLCMACHLDSKGSRDDLVNRLREEMKTRHGYDKIFQNIWRASASLPFKPHEGRLAASSHDDITAAQNNKLKVSLPWMDIHSLVPQTTMCGMINSTNDPQEVLRRINLVPELQDDVSRGTLCEDITTWDKVGPCQASWKRQTHPAQEQLTDMPALRKWWCVVLMDNFDLGSHGKMFAHWTEKSKALLRGEVPPVFRVRKRKVDDITEVRKGGKEKGSFQGEGGEAQRESVQHPRAAGRVQKEGKRE
ncbi:hypothetical protein KUCAC02_001942, partial [Chaenocephalus aceratus]